MKSLISVVSVLCFAICIPVFALEENRKEHGPLDGHAVKVMGVLKKMEFSAKTQAELGRIVENAQADYRNWFKKNRDKVAHFDKTIKALKKTDKKEELKKVLAEKKVFMHTAPSILRHPEPIKNVLAEDQYKAFIVKLDALKKALHNPKGKKKAE